MPIQLLGKDVVAALSAQISADVTELKEQGTHPCLALIRVGEREDDSAYERSILLRCEKLGLLVQSFHFTDQVSESELISCVEKINNDPSIHGCLMFRPLPKHIDDEKVCETLVGHKDVDGITNASKAAVYAGSQNGFAPCTAQACIELLDYYGIPLEGKRVTVIGRSFVIGKPVAMLLLERNATLKICHTRTVDLAAECRSAEILIAAAGRAGVVDGSFVSEGQIVIDVGINVDEDGNLCGDVKTAEVAPLVAAYTPVPGGVGTVTTTVLIKHVVEAAQNISAE